MGWMSNIFKRREAEQPQQPQRSVPIDELISILEKRMRERSAPFESDLVRLHEGIRSSAKEFSQALSKLQEAPGPERIDEGIMNVAKSYRLAMSKAFAPLFSEAEKQAEYDIDGFNSYFSRCMKLMRGAESDVMRFVQPLKEVFPGEMKSVMRASEQMDGRMSDVSERLAKISAETRPVSDAISAASEASTKAAKVRDAEAQVSSLRSSIEEAKAEKAVLDKGLSDLLTGEDWSSYQGKKQEVTAAEKKKDEIRSVVIQSISPLDKAMKRLRKAVAEGTESFADKELLELYITDPVEAFLRDADQKVVMEIIARIKSASEKGELDIDTRKEQKILEKLSEVESGGLLASFRKDYERFEEAVSRLAGEMEGAPVLRRKLEVENGLKEVEARIASEERRLLDALSFLTKAKDEKDALVSVLRMKVREAMGEDLVVETGS